MIKEGQIYYRYASPRLDCVEYLHILKIDEFDQDVYYIVTNDKKNSSFSFPKEQRHYWHDYDLFLDFIKTGQYFLCQLYENPLYLNLNE